MPGVKSPLVWFLIIGSILFAVDGYRNNAVESAASTIKVDQQVTQRIRQLWQSQMSRPPTAAELAALIDGWVKDEMFYREALALGLDRDDTIVRRRMIQKLGFLIEGIAEQQPTTSELNTFYVQNQERYRLPHRYTFSQIFFNEKEAALALSAAMIDTVDWRKLGNPNLLPKILVSKSEREIAATLGNPFVKHLAALQQGHWLGPLESSYGFHWVRLESEIHALIPPFEQLRRQVAVDYEAIRKQQAAADYYATVKEHFKVEYQ